MISKEPVLCLTHVPMFHRQLQNFSKTKFVGIPLTKMKILLQ